MAVKKVTTTEEREAVMRVYETGYLIAPSVKEDDIESIVSGIRSVIEKASGSFIAEGAPSMMKLAYEMEGREVGKRMIYDRAYFGWIKFEAATSAVGALEVSYKRSTEILRHLIFKTLREDTRAKIKAPTLREVKRTDTLKTTPRRAEESAEPVSEEDIDKAIEDLTTE